MQRAFQVQIVVDDTLLNVRLKLFAKRMKTIISVVTVVVIVVIFKGEPW